jgi:hypothetical protein
MTSTSLHASLANQTDSAQKSMMMTHSWSHQILSNISDSGDDESGFRTYGQGNWVATHEGVP